MTEIRHLVDPEPVRTELENAAVVFLLDQWQAERVAVKCHHRIVGVIRTFNRDVCAAEKLGTVNVGDHQSCLRIFFARLFAFSIATFSSSIPPRATVISELPLAT